MKSASFDQTEPNYVHHELIWIATATILARFESSAWLLKWVYRLKHYVYMYADK
jgi:hypothetical protein